MAAIESLTGQSLDVLTEQVALAYKAAKGKNLPKVSLTNPKEDAVVKGRIHFTVKSGSRVLGTGMFKPRHRSVWVDWK
jgi:hypothetical protein